MRRITKAALGGLAGCALVLGGTQAAMSAVEYIPYLDDLVDTGTMPADGPFKGASAALRLKVTGEGTNFKLQVSDIQESGVGKPYGAHLHTLACDERATPTGQPGGPHYNHEVYGVVPGKAFPSPPGAPPSETVAAVGPTTEVWFNFVPNAHGDATDSTFVPFLPVDPDGKMSIVVHLATTNPATGLAGDRQACFPIDASWAPTSP